MRRWNAGSMFGLALSLAACDGLMVEDQAAPTTSAVAPTMETEIMVGRVEVMQDQTQRGLDLLAGRPLPAESTHEPSDGVDTYRRLYNAVERYNALRSAACGAKLLGDDHCAAPPYMPLWFAGRARPDTSPTGLAVMAEEMQNQMIPLWGGVCAKAVAKSGDEQFCAIE